MPNTTCIAAICCSGSASSPPRPRRSTAPPRSIRRARRQSGRSSTCYSPPGASPRRPPLGGELLRAFPDDEASAAAVLRPAEPPPRHDRRRLCRARRPHAPAAAAAAPPPPASPTRLRSQRRVIHALIIRETRTRFGDSRLGYGWALIEPILHIALLVGDVRAADARPAADRHAFLHLLLHRPHSLSRVRPHQQRHDPCDHRQRVAAAIAAGHHVRRDRRARPARVRHRHRRRGDPAGRASRAIGRGRRCRTICGAPSLALSAIAALGCGARLRQCGAATVFFRSWDKTTAR